MQPRQSWNLLSSQVGPQLDIILPHVPGRGWPLISQLSTLPHCLALCRCRSQAGLSENREWEPTAQVQQSETERGFLRKGPERPPWKCYYKAAALCWSEDVVIESGNVSVPILGLEQKEKKKHSEYSISLQFPTGVVCKPSAFCQRMFLGTALYFRKFPNTSKICTVHVLSLLVL